MNPLELFENPAVTDVMVSGNEYVQVEVDGKLQETSLAFETEMQCREYAKKILAEAEVRIDISKPFGEATLATEFGSLRFHSILGGECSSKTQISIRRHPLENISLQNLKLGGSITEEQFLLLKQIVLERKNFVIIGPTGSGKTTLLRAMLCEAVGERIITIEDSAELQIPKSISLITRGRNHEGLGEITLSDLVRESLRMRPDRLVIGEARGSELAVLLQVMNTGHSGVGFTLHANAASEVSPRMIAMLAMGNIQPSLARMLISSSIDFVLELDKSIGRVLKSITRMDEHV